MVFDLDDVIAAPASAPGPSARAILRISGDGCRDAVRSIFVPDCDDRWKAAKVAARHTGRLRLTEPALDLPATAAVWPTRRSYTGQPLVELQLPGSPPLVEAALAELYRAGVRPARPGEFTLRAFLAGRIDLVQAEAVLGVIDAVDHRELDSALRQLAGGLSGRLADVRSDLLMLLADLEAGLDFVEEDIEFVSREAATARVTGARQVIDELLADASERWRDAGRARVVLAGLPNAGKSTLFNAIVGKDHAIVSPVAGTTRDWLTADVEFDEAAVELIDTAGWETASDDLGVAMDELRAEQLERADLIVWCSAADAPPRWRDDDAQLRERLGALHEKTIVIDSKIDLAPGEPLRAARVQPDGDDLAVSAVTGEGLARLQHRIAFELAVERSGSRQMMGSTAARGRQSLEAARDALDRALAASADGFGDEIVASELRLALDGLAAVLGTIYTDDVLDVLFSRFCIGK
ncbi:MAG: tRNA modification GTPase [Planctomycetaceae bacterium]